MCSEHVVKLKLIVIAWLVYVNCLSGKLESVYETINWLHMSVILMEDYVVELIYESFLIIFNL